MERQRPVDLLEDRRAETLSRWLQQHRGVEVISRDRSTEYLRGAREGPPQAQQVLDRWHVLEHLRKAVERLFTRLYASLQALVSLPDQTPLRQKRAASERACSEGVRRRRLERYEQVRAAYEQGGRILGIARQLKMSRQSVRKFIQAARFSEWGKAARTRRAIDPYRPYLSERWRQGRHGTTELWPELQACGFSGSWMRVYRWVQLQEEQEAQTARTLQPAKQPGSPSPALVAPPHLAWLLMRERERLDEDEQQMLAVIRQDQQVNGAYEIVQPFVRMVKAHDAKALETWLTACLTSGISKLVNFAQGVQKEASALHAGLKLPYSNGPVEGKINKLKDIKRSMYGRGGFMLLRQRVLKVG